MDELKINPRFKEAIPPLSCEEYGNLRESIRMDGCRDSIITWDGVIVDGHNRYGICRELNLPFDTAEKTFENEGAAIEWIMFNQLGRRNLTDVERGRIALKLKDSIAARARGNQGARSDLSPTLAKGEPIDTREELARIAGISHGTLDKIEMVDNEAPVVISDAMGKTISINKAALLTCRLKRLPEDEREAEAAAMLSIESELKGDMYRHEDKIMKKIRNLYSSAIKDYEYICPDCVDVYIKNTIESTNSILKDIDCQMELLRKLKQLFINRDAAYDGPRHWKID
jgi:hypothetical protein